MRTALAMLNEQPTPAIEDAAAVLKARDVLARRLADIVCLPTSRITPQERHMTGDLLIDILREVDSSVREKIARRISALPEAPSAVLRWLACGQPSTAEHVILGSQALTDADLASIARSGGPDHRILIARRREVSSLVTEFLIDREEVAVIEAVLGNPEAKISDASVDTIVRISRDNALITRLLARRKELKPRQGLTLFWWADAEARKKLLMRFAVDRHLLQDSASDVFAMASRTKWSDAITRKTLQFIERRQRNRAAIDKSPYDSLEHAVEVAVAQGMGRSLVEELSYLSGVRPATGVKIFTDMGGEPIAVLCKATGLKRPSLEKLWAAMRRGGQSSDVHDPAYERVLDVYESLSNDKAQTVLRYWNWALTSAISPTRAYEAPEQDLVSDAYSASERIARLVWGKRS